MAIFEEKEKGRESYIALLDSKDELIAFISPVKSVSKELIVEALKAKGLNVELREPQDEKLSIVL